MIDIYLLFGLVSLLGLILFVMVDIDIPLGHELEFSFKGVLLGTSFSSFILYYIQNFINNKMILFVVGVILFIIGYKLLIKLVSFLKKGETGDVFSNKELLGKSGKIIHSFEKEDVFLYEISIDENKYIAKANIKLDEKKAIFVADVNQLNEIIIINIDLN